MSLLGTISFLKKFVSPNRLQFRPQFFPTGKLKYYSRSRNDSEHLSVRHDRKKVPDIWIGFQMSWILI